MKILYIGDVVAYRAYTQGKIPSHFLYGACEMEKDGHHVVWSQERHSFLNDLKLVWIHKPDAIFIPNLNMSAHFFLLLISSFNLLAIPVYAFLHREPRASKGVKGLLYKVLLSGVKHIFFLSEKTMEATIQQRQARKDQCSVPWWGADYTFYKDVVIKDNGYFVSTGKENRDFDLLIEAFKITGAPLKIITAKTHAGVSHEYLVDKCKDIPNIQVSVIENTGDVYPIVLKAMAEAHALVCPLKQEKLNYCVGLSSVVDAEILRKPLIITYNPYHSKERMKYFQQVVTLEDWENAINSVASFRIVEQSHYSMENTYKNMMKRIL